MKVEKGVEDEATCCDPFMFACNPVTFELQGS